MSDEWMNQAAAEFRANQEERQRNAAEQERQQLERAAQFAKVGAPAWDDFRKFITEAVGRLNTSFGTDVFTIRSAPNTGLEVTASGKETSITWTLNAPTPSSAWIGGQQIKRTTGGGMSTGGSGLGMRIDLQSPERPFKNRDDSLTAKDAAEQILRQMYEAIRPHL
jgi:hypothetical protein